MFTTEALTISKTELHHGDTFAGGHARKDIHHQHNCFV